MVDAATPSGRAVIARMPGDAGSTTFVQGSSAFLQGERPQITTTPAPGGDKAACKHPPEYRRQIFLTGREAAGLLGIGVCMPERLQAAGDGPACRKFGKQTCYARTDLPTRAWTPRVNARGRLTGRFRQTASTAAEALPEFEKILHST